MLDILGVLDQIAATTKKSEKLAIMEDVKTSSELSNLFKKVCKMAYDPSFNYYIKDIELPLEELVSPCVTLGQALHDVEHCIASRMFTGNMARNWLTEMFLNLEYSDAIVLLRVIKQDLRCGISAKTINKVFPDLIYVHPFQRCSSFSRKNLTKMKFPCYSQTKMDGMYADFVFDAQGECTVYSRSGEVLSWVDTSMFNNSEDESMISESVLMGELVGLNEDGSIMSREKSNGYVGSDDVNPSRVMFIVWDLVGLTKFRKGKDLTEYKQRFDLTKSFVKSLQHPRVALVRTLLVNSVEEVAEHFRQERELGNEGTIIKNMGAVWKDGTNTEQVKIKVVFDCEMKAVAWKYGEGQFTDQLGAITFESSDGEISVSVGGGYKQEEREQWINQVQDWVDSGRVAKIRANDVTQTEKGLSLFLPRFVEWRTDKHEADDRETIFKEAKSFVDALKMIA